MTFLVWIMWFVLQRAEGTLHIGFIMLAVVISSSVFGFGHLPIAFALSSQVTTSLILYVVIGNSLFGLIAGYLYWHTGLEAAMIAHMLVHGVMAVVDSLKS